MTSNTPNSPIRRVGVLAWTFVGVFAVIAILVWLAIQAQIIVIPVVFAGVIVYLLNPFVTRLQRLHIGRTIGTAIGYILGFVLIFGIGMSMAPVLSQQTVDLVDDIPLFYANVADWIVTVAESAGFSDVNLMTFDELIAQVSEPGFVLSQGVQDFAGTAFGLALGFLEAVLLFFLAPVIAFYILVDLPRVRGVAIGLLPRANKEEAVHVADRLGRALGGFVRGQLLAATIVAVLSAIGYRAVGLKLWLVIGIIAGLLNMVPMVGPWIGGLLAISAALVDGELGLVAGVAIVAVVVQQIDNHFVSPLVLRATVKLHPALIILSLMVGGSVAGLLGVVLAVPLTAAAKVLASHYWRTRVLGEPWKQVVEEIIEEPDITRTGEILVERIRARRLQAEREEAKPEDGE